MQAPARPHRRLIWKYTAIVVALVGAAIVSVGLTELYFSYHDSRSALSRVEQDKAAAAAASIEQQMQEVLRQLQAVAQPTVAPGTAGLAERNQDFHRLLGRETLVSQLSYLDAAGKESVRSSPLELDRIDSGIDFSRSQALPPRAGGAAVLRPGVLRAGLPAAHDRSPSPSMAPEAASWSPRST